jgi:hypothetical protein
MLETIKHLMKHSLIYWIGLAYPFALWAFRFYEKEELEALKGLFRSQLSHWRNEKARS